VFDIYVEEDTLPRDCMADITDFQLGQGETFRILVHLKNRTMNNTPLDITDYTFAGQVRENYTTDEVAATLAFTKVEPYASGAVFIGLSPEQTVVLDQRKYVYDVYLSYPSDEETVTRRILEGSLTVRPAVTK
jgi:hypothetical protein